MATTVDRVLGEALKLAPDERARIVVELLASLEPDVPSDRRTEAEGTERPPGTRPRASATGGGYWSEGLVPGRNQSVARGMVSLGKSDTSTISFPVPATWSV